MTTLTRFADYRQRLLPEGEDADNMTAPDLSEAQDCGLDVEHGGAGPHFCHLEQAATAWLAKQQKGVSP